MRSEELAVHLDVSARCAQVGGWARPFAQPAEQLNLDGDREVLVLAHALRGLTMDHDPAVACGPTGAFFRLLADETVFNGDDVMRELLAIEDVAEAAVELVVLLIADLHHAVFHAKSGAEIIIQVVTGD